MTANDVYEHAIALIDEINPSTGAVSVDTTEDYEARAPYLIDLLQKELAGNYTKTYEVTLDGEAIQLPNDVDTIEKIVLSDNPTERIIYYRETDKVYIVNYDSGKARITYKAIPPKVTALTDTLVIDEISLVALAYGLAKKFVEVEQNDFLVGIFTREYDRQRALASIRKPTSIEKITNVYGRV